MRLGIGEVVHSIFRTVVKIAEDFWVEESIQGKIVGSFSEVCRYIRDTASWNKLDIVEEVNMTNDLYTQLIKVNLKKIITSFTRSTITRYNSNFLLSVFITL